MRDPAKRWHREGVRPSKTKPRMSERGTRSSLRKWRHKRAYRAERHAHYHHARRGATPELERHRTELASKWHRLEADAAANVRKRRSELAWYEQNVSPRRRATRAALSHAGHVTEQPPGSNRGGLITEWERRLANGGEWLVGEPWCGTFVANMLLEAGVQGINSRLASVALIEDDARAARAPFTAWTLDPGRVRAGDLVVLFGRGVHVELVLYVSAGIVHTVGGNTSAGTAGSQSNGGGAYERARPISQVHGFALVRYPTT